MDYPLLQSLTLPADIKNLSYEQLEDLALETRQCILQTVSKNGGHLAPSLGVVELTLALLRLTDPIEDRIIWDVSHQSYPFKILTDRFDKFHSLRKLNGISGFTKIAESPYDAFGTGHASTSISAGLGIVAADQIIGRRRKVAAVIGDGSLSGGMAFEGLNNLGASASPMVVILNDNEMSISPNVGALSSTLSRMLTGELSTSLRRDMRRFLDTMPGKLTKIARRVEESVLSFFTTGIIFEELGLRYIGPIDGHKIKDLEKALNTAFQHDGPVLVHIATVKGKGYAPAEARPDNYHGISSFDLETGKPKKFNGAKTWTAAFGEKLCQMATADSRIVAITAAMKDGTGLNLFAEEHPKRFFDVGIAEEHAMTFAAGLASAGLRPFVALYSSFLQRAYDQLIHDVALQNLPVRICVDRAGLVGQDGATHHGVFDISFLRHIPNMSLFLPKDLQELGEMMELMNATEGPAAIRYPRGGAANFNLPRNAVVLGEPEIIYTGGDIAIVSAGHMFGEALKSYEILKAKGVDATLINLRFIKPLNTAALLAHIANKAQIITFEDNVRTGGVGEMIAAMLKEAGSNARLNILALPDDFVTHGSVTELYELCGLTAEKAIAGVSL